MTVKGMKALSQPIDSPTAGGQAARRRRIAAFLLAGWFAFWLTSVLAPFCDNLFENAQPAAAPLVLQATDGDPAGNDRCYTPCPELASAQPARPAFLAVSTDSTPRVPEGLSYAITFFVPTPPEPSKLSLTARPLVSAPFHLRTSRLLI